MNSLYMFYALSFLFAEHSLYDELIFILNKVFTLFA